VVIAEREGNRERQGGRNKNREDSSTVKQVKEYVCGI
jgi:hypothetical protein